MTFLTLQQELASVLGLDQTIAAQATLLKRWLNTSQQIIFQAFDWPFLKGSAPLIVQTVVDYTAGTVATTAGSTSVTFSATIAESKQGQYLRTSSSNDWYRITSHSAGSASATLEAAALSTAAAATYTIRKFYYSTSSAVDRITSIREYVTPNQLTEKGRELFDEYRLNLDDTNTPRIWFEAGQDSNNYPQFTLFPSPDAAINLYVEYIRTATDMSADGDVSVIPSKWHTSVLLEGAKWQGYNFLDDTRADSALLIFKEGMEEMKRNYTIGQSRERVTRAIDENPLGRPVPFPANFPEGYSF